MGGAFAHTIYILQLGEEGERERKKERERERKKERIKKVLAELGKNNKQLTASPSVIFGRTDRPAIQLEIRGTKKHRGRLSLLPFSSVQQDKPRARISKRILFLFLFLFCAM